MTLPQEIQIFSWIAAAFLAIVTAVLAIINFRGSIRQRQLDLRWRKAQAAIAFIHDMHGHELAAAAFFMFDWLDSKTQSPVEIQAKGPLLTYAELVGLVCSSDEDVLNDSQHHILHCLDWLFYYVDRMEQNIRDGFFEFDNVKYIFLPYYEKISKHRNVFNKFSVKHRYLLVPDFLEAFRR
jgi:hypothetical protein